MSLLSHVPLCHASEVLTNLRLPYITLRFVWLLDLVLGTLKKKKPLIMSVFLIRGHSVWRHKLSWTLASF